MLETPNKTEISTTITNNHQILTAIELENNAQNINNIVEQRVIDFNKKRIRKAIKILKDEKKLANKEKQEKLTSEENTLLNITLPEIALTKEEIDNINKSIINDVQSKKFKEFEYISIKSQKDNYHEMRSTIEDLNTLTDYAHKIEKAELQTYTYLPKYSEIVTTSVTNNLLFFELKIHQAKKVELYVQTIKTNNLPKDIDYDILSCIVLMREMYRENIDIDDFELFDKYNLETNIDLSAKLSYLFLLKHSKGFISENIINEFVPKAKILKILNNLVYQQIVSNKMLGMLFSTQFITNNKTTILETAFVNNVNVDLVYRTRTLGELLLEITNSDIATLSKESRQQIYMTYDGIRPSKEEYYKWNGLQIYDLDLKYWIRKSNGNLNHLKKLIHELLSDFHWYLWICVSASGNGLHIYTKVTAPHHVYINAKDNDYISKYWYNVNYVNKLQNIYDVLGRLHNINNNNINFEEFWFKQKGTDIIVSEPNNIFENKYIDNVVSRITAGVRLTYDSHPLINHNFIDLHVGLGLGQTFDGYENILSIDNIILKPNKYTKFIDDELAINDISSLTNLTNKPDKIDLSKYVQICNDIEEIVPLKKINYSVRYNVCNTLAAVFGKDGLSIAHSILDSTKCKNVGEINSFYSCALSNKKEPSKLGLEILKKCGLLKSVEEEILQETENEFKLSLKTQIEKSINNTEQNYTIKLSSKEYVSHKKEILFDLITGNKINILLSPPGSGKTELIKDLAKEGKRVLLVLPYISVITNKIEKDPSITEYFDVFYGTKDIRELDYGRNAVTTFDKFSRANFEKISKMFDYIMIDESHLLFTSSYRIEATSNVIKKIKELYFISSNDPFAAKIVLFTGTETGESSFFSQVANIIRISKPSLDKQIEFLICGDILDAITRLASKAATLISDGYKLMIPTNKGEIYSEKIIGMIQYLLQRDIKYGYYKRSNTQQEICQLINNDNSVGDYEIIFCSNYLSVGVDINDEYETKDGVKTKIKFASLYFGNFSGYEIEQFNARIRKTGIKTIYCIATNKNDGTTNEVLLTEPDLLLKITDEEKMFFVDDKSIAEAKTEFIAAYDPVLHKIVTPGFSLLNGKILFNIEEYELISFENKYSLCMEHPIKVARELSKYYYKISVSTEFEGLSITEQNVLKKMGIAAAKEEKVRKHNLLVGTFVDLIKNNNYVNEHGLEFANIIEWIGKNTALIIEDRELTKEVWCPITKKSIDEECFVFVIFDVFATPQQVIVRSKEALEKMYKSAKYLIKKYSVTKSLDIINQYIDDSGILKQKLFNRAINLLKLIDSSEANELAEPIARSLEKMYDFVDKFENKKDLRIGYETYQSILDAWCNEYIDALGIKINTKYGFDKIKDGLVEMLADISTKQSSKNGIRFTYNKMPEQDSSNIISRKTIDGIIQNMFNLTENVIINKSKAKQKHIILVPQAF